jgi:hypothetical protein
VTNISYSIILRSAAGACQRYVGNKIIHLSSKSTYAAVRHLRTKYHFISPNDGDIEASDLASATIEDSEPTVMSTLLQSINVNRFRDHLVR